MSGLADSQREDAQGPRPGMPGLRRGAGDQALEHPGHHLRAVQHGGGHVQGVGAELAHYQQNNAGEGGLEPLIALGKHGRAGCWARPSPATWQVVGYQERCDLPAPGDDDEQVFWREYLLYNREHGFAFLVDAEDGWSWVRPITGTPDRAGRARSAGSGITYLRKYSVPTPRSPGCRASSTGACSATRKRASPTTWAPAAPAAKPPVTGDHAGEAVTWSAGQTLDARRGGRCLRPGRRPARRPRSGATPRRCRPTLRPPRPSCPRGRCCWWLLVLVRGDPGRPAASDGCDEVRKAFGARAATSTSSAKRKRQLGRQLSAPAAGPGADTPAAAGTSERTRPPQEPRQERTTP